MRYTLLLSSIVLLGIACRAAVAQDVAKPESKPESKPAASQADDKTMAGLRATTQAYSDAFDRHDAAAVAGMWTADGDYVDDEGRRLSGRESIEKEYASLFEQYPKAAIHVVPASARTVAPGVAIEDGTIVLTPAPQWTPTVSRYTAVYVEQNGAWRISNVRETRYETPSHQGRLADLSWLIGQWRANREGASIRVTCDWAAGASFIERRYEVRNGDDITSSGVQIIGWDPTTERITSWTFNSDGGHGMAAWTRRDDGWVEESVGVLADGTRTKATNIFTRKDENTLVWKSVDRTAGDTQLADMADVLLQRVATQK
ncbi:MAG: SgcJ/EcaC family oxidoreductase [Pirellulaceae bacterium]